MRNIKKRIFSLLEADSNEKIDIIADYIFELGLIEALEKKDPILYHPNILTYLSITNDLLGIKKNQV
jgi:hypothetical protein